jgi:hypothetical protein
MSRTPEEIYQNLLDAGYTRASRGPVHDLCKQWRPSIQQHDLSVKRTKILETSQENRHLECLDYLLL